MSKIRGVFPLFLATTFGIANGIWVFQPLLAAQQDEKDEQTKRALDLAPQSEESDNKILREAEAAACRSSAAESALTPFETSSSWWPKLSLWSKAENGGNKESPKAPASVDHTKKDGGS